MVNYKIYLKCIVAIVIIIIIFLSGAFIYENFSNIFGSLGLTSLSDKGRRVDELIGQIADRDRLLVDAAKQYQQSLERNEAESKQRLADERARADSLAEENRILRSGLQSNETGEVAVREAIASAQRIRGYAGAIADGIRILRQTSDKPDPLMEDNSDR